MDTFFLNELKMCCAGINSDRENEDGISRVVDACKRAISFSEMVVNEGMIALDAACDDLDEDDITQKFLHIEVQLIMDGTAPQDLSEMSMNMLAANDYSSYERLIVLIYSKTIELIVKGTDPFEVKEYIQSLLPFFINERLLKSLTEDRQAKQLENDEKNDKLIRALCQDDKKIDERDYSIINQTALTLLEMSDTELQTILRNTDNHDIEMAMKELPGMARAHIFENVSVRLGRMIAEDIAKMGKVPLGEVEKACVAIMKKVIKLEADGELEYHNLTVLKFVLGVYDMSNTIQ